MKRKYIILIIPLLVLNIGFAQESTRSILKQRSNSDIGKKSAAKYIFSPGSDALLMTVKVWGEVKQPGIYEVPIGMDLIELISSAGGPTNSAKLSKVKIIRSEDIIQNNDNNQEVNNSIISANVREYLNSGNPETIPILKPNDTVVIPIKPTQYLLTTFSWTQQVMSLFSIYTMIIYYTSRASK